MTIRRLVWHLIWAAVWLTWLFIGLNFLYRWFDPQPAGFIGVSAVMAPMALEKLGVKRWLLEADRQEPTTQESQPEPPC
ncbi:hypothetical protein HC028_02750 [Planosporangium flavigriseum]|uniref:Uncharacterized protein n=1 Tax=Planosporangium flavigriseum TaxID=373681 RepID=A0A8J3LNQ8_9ACTN|nr:hypothetical protein [Planosporangium flavigriseum]NJC63434.1 hypothetical protein [Planosporangium flavigriseum]GIG76508.1 hypothetical protein Pfl04_49120 [Planosporangium flavigriseum]